jgi:hypothetical protein
MCVGDAPTGFWGKSVKVYQISKIKSLLTKNVDVLGRTKVWRRSCRKLLFIIVIKVSRVL